MAKLGERKWTDQQLIESFPKARSTLHLSQMLGLKRPNKALKRRATELGLDIQSLDKLHERHTYSVEKLVEAVRTSYSLAGVLDKLNIVVGGGNYSTLKKRIAKYHLDTSHWTGQGWSRNKQLKKTTGDYSTKGCTKKKLLSIRGHKCENCDNIEWLGIPTPIEVHHIDGNRKNNAEHNLQLLCPNCHALTENYRRKISKSQ